MIVLWEDLTKRVLIIRAIKVTIRFIKIIICLNMRKKEIKIINSNTITGMLINFVNTLYITVHAWPSYM